MPLVAGPGGVDIDLRLATAAAFKGQCLLLQPLGSGFWRLTLTPDQRDPMPYGSACGAHLTVTEDLIEPGRPRFSVVDTTPPSIAVLAVGVQRTAAAIGPCTLYTMPTLDASGTLHATQGVELLCR